MRKLVICEKNLSASRIALILSDGRFRRRSGSTPIFEFERADGKYFVIGLRGHIIALDYPEKYNDWHSVSIPELVKVDPIKSVDHFGKRILDGLRQLASETDEIMIATDYDREGELIGVETLEELSWDRPIARAKFSTLTRQEILSAFEEPVQVDFKLASAAETRQIIDLKWGAALTRFISITSGQTGRDFLSAGRVQSPTLAIVVDREREIQEFVPTSFWKIIADLSAGEEEKFSASHANGTFSDREEANRVFQKVKLASEGTVGSYSEEIKEEYPPVPFNTTQFLAEASKLGVSAAQAMKIAESLYTEGYISYPRTDNTVYPSSLNLRNILRALQDTEFGKYAKELLSAEKIRATRGRKSTTDHPPIYPTTAAKKEDLRGNKWKIYELVCRRFLATVSPNSKVEEQNSQISIEGEPFAAKGRKLLEPGWRKIYVYWGFDGAPIPKLVEGQKLSVLRVGMKEDRTKPPSRYTQGMLIQKMESDGLGTKSTRHEIIQKLYDRKFVHGSRITPTPTGVAIITALENHANMITDKKMTSHLEEDMDLIARGDLTKEEVIEESQAMLEDIVEVLLKNQKEISNELRAALRQQKNLGKCPNCDGELTIIQMRGNKRFIGCSRYPECKTAFPVPAMGHIEPTGEICKSCGSPMVKIPERGRQSGSICINPECEVNKKKSDMGKCPSCDGRLRIIFSSRGKRFLGCDNYPECKTTFPLPQKGGVISEEKQCDKCGAPIIRVVSKGKKPWVLCANPDCPGKNNRNNGKKRSS
ncbi:MAG TPA: DNA topoisomerase I [Euryarchaeota archaeon]|nr:DNA topoisomerase I [Euryarchaeota archaeon]